MEQDLKNNTTAWWMIFCCWLIASISTGASLFFSEVMEFPPCTLCWYQRIAMYPLVILFLTGLISLDRTIIRYSLPLTTIGWFFALYHNLLHWGIIPESAAPCREGVMCSTVYLDWGFITIPFMSLFAFTVILIILINFYRKFYK